MAAQLGPARADDALVPDDPITHTLIDLRDAARARGEEDEARRWQERLTEAAEQRDASSRTVPSVSVFYTRRDGTHVQFFQDVDAYAKHLGKGVARMIHDGKLSRAQAKARLREQVGQDRRVSPTVMDVDETVANILRKADALLADPAWPPRSSGGTPDPELVELLEDGDE